MTTSDRPSGNPFADPPAPALPTSAPGPSDQARPVSGPSGSGEEPSGKPAATLHSFQEVPVTGYPVQYSGGAFSTSYPHYGSSTSTSYPQFGSSSSAPSYPPPYPSVDQGNAPLYSSFEQSAPYQSPAPATPMACGIGAQVMRCLLATPCSLLLSQSCCSAPAQSYAPITSPRVLQWVIFIVGWLLWPRKCWHGRTAPASSCLCPSRYLRQLSSPLLIVLR
jgi:hypothetical protein